MCGRYATTRTPAELDDAFGLRLADSTARLEADYNVAPTKLAPLVIGRSQEDDAGIQRELLAATWGLVPSWAKDRAIGNKMINARSETVAEKPAFRRAFATRRALVPADGFYEWYAGSDHRPKQPKQPFFITSPDRSVLALAGLYEFWRADPEQEWLITFTILTTSAEDAQGRLHDRAPLLVHDEALDAWLEPVRKPPRSSVRCSRRPRPVRSRPTPSTQRWATCATTARSSSSRCRCRSRASRRVHGGEVE